MYGPTTSNVILNWPPLCALTRSETVNAPGLAAMVVKDGVDYQSLDNQPAKLFFMIAVPKTGGNEHLQILAMLS